MNIEPYNRYFFAMHLLNSCCREAIEHKNWVCNDLFDWCLSIVTIHSGKKCLKIFNNQIAADAVITYEYFKWYVYKMYFIDSNNVWHIHTSICYNILFQGLCMCVVLYCAVLCALHSLSSAASLSLKRAEKWNLCVTKLHKKLFFLTRIIFIDVVFSPRAKLILYN